MIHKKLLLEAFQSARLNITPADIAAKMSVSDAGNQICM